MRENINKNNIIFVKNPGIKKKKLNLFQKVLRKINVLITQRSWIKKKGKNEINWSLRAKQDGFFSVIDYAHGALDFNYVTKKQKEIIYPYLKKHITTKDKNILDFGCGPGRFTYDLASMINGNAIGFDPTIEFIKMCKDTKEVVFINNLNYINKDKIKFDIIWICLVLGGLNNQELNVTANKIEEMLEDKGFLFFVESTGKKFINGRWRTRTVNQYKKLFSGFNLDRLGVYYDAESEISIFGGRKI